MKSEAHFLGIKYTPIMFYFLQNEHIIVLLWFQPAFLNRLMAIPNH